MKIINDINKITNSLLKNNTYIEGHNLHPSMYMVKAKVDDGLLLYNTFTKELLLLSNDESIDDETIKTKLIEKWFFVSENFDEIKYLKEVRSTLKLIGFKPTVLKDFTIFTTTDCNARCYYCYEKGSKKISMSEKVAHDVASFIIESSRGEKVSLHWFGGEPLYNSDAINIICSDLKNNSIEYDSRIISNCYLFDEEMIKKAKELWNLKKVQATLDGTEEIYNKTKAYIYNDVSAYSVVIKNIKRLLEYGIKVNLRLNLNANNYNDLNNLIDELKTNFDGMNNLSVYSALLYNYIGNGHGFVDKDEAYLKQKELNNKLISLGLRKRRHLNNEERITQCMASNDNGVTILPDGHLGKCEHCLDDGYIGDIYNGITNYDLVDEWKRVKEPIELCKTCAAFPICSITLDKCPSNQNECTLNRKNNMIQSIQEKMINTYLKYKNERNKEL